MCACGQGIHLRLCDKFSLLPLLGASEGRLLVLYVDDHQLRGLRRLPLDGTQTYTRELVSKQVSRKFIASE